MASRPRAVPAPSPLGDGIVFRPIPTADVVVRPVPGAGAARAARGSRGTALDAAIADTGARVVRSVRIEPRPGARAGRAGARVGTMEIETAAREAVVLLRENPDGTTTWLYPEPAGAGRRRARTAMAGRRRWRCAVDLPRAAGSRRRGASVAGVAGALVKVIVFEVLDRAAGDLLEHLVRRHERKAMVEGLKPVTPDGFPAPTAPALRGPELRAMAGRRALVFVHGTFSNGQGAFRALDRATLERLSALYPGGLYAFDHFTLSRDPVENAQLLLDALPLDQGPLEIDLVAHSRGGLVARVLTEMDRQPQVRFGNVVLFGTPNAGTPLADPARLAQCLDLVTNLAGLVPGFAGLFVLSWIVAAVQWLAANGVGKLPGLAAQRPRSELLERLNDPESSTTARYAAVTADYQAGAGLLARLADHGMDALMGEANDLVVPTASATAVDLGARPPALAPGRVLRYRGGVVSHCDFFAQPRSCRFLLETLAPPAEAAGPKLSKRILEAQRGVPLAVRSLRRPAGAPFPPPAVHALLATIGGRRGRVGRGPGRARRGAVVPPADDGSWGSLSCDQRLRLLDGLERAIEGAFAHLPLKRARYGFDPVQRLRILRTQVAELSNERFHADLAEIVTGLRDAHTRYVGPASLADQVAVLPFLLEMAGTPEDPTYVVTRTGPLGPGVPADFRPGAIVDTWNFMPIDRAVVLYSDREVGGRADSQRVLATQSLTMRPLQYGPPPDESLVVVGYRPVGAEGRVGAPREARIEWRIVNPSRIDSERGAAPSGPAGRRLRRTRAVDPAAAAMRKAKMLLFAPASLEGRAARRPARPGLGREIPTRMPQVIKASEIPAADGPFGYLRIWAFDADTRPFLAELRRLVPLLPDRGLVVDVRGNPGGYICAAESALQLFTPKRIEPTRFAPLATPFVRALAARDEAAEDLGPWRPSLDAAVRNGELYAQPIPITDPGECNALGQHYGGPVLLVADATTYSAGDLFSAGFVDNAIGPFVCVGSATGAGGANVWDYEDLRSILEGSPQELPPLPAGIGLTLSFRRATRSGPSEGLPIEDVGIRGEEYAMTRDDLLCDNRDLIAHCLDLLRGQPFTRLVARVDRAARAVRVETRGLDTLEVFLDGHAEGSRRITDDKPTSVPYRAGTREIRLVGLQKDVVRQERRLSLA